MRITLFKVPFIDKIYKYRVDNQNIFQKYNFFSTYQNFGDEIYFLLIC